MKQHEIAELRIAKMRDFETTISKLRNFHGELEANQTSDPFELIVVEVVAYLVDDPRRLAAFNALRERVGLRPVQIISASITQLMEITRLAGIHAELRAHRLQDCAHIVLNDFDGDLSKVLRLPLKEAIKALKQFPSIGGPGAEKILLFCHAYPLLTLDSNGLRVCLRLGFGEEKKNYSASYKSVQNSLAAQISDDYDFLISAHQLLRRHGKEICKNTHPKCDHCPLTKTCRYYQSIAT